MCYCTFYCVSLEVSDTVIALRYSSFTCGVVVICSSWRCVSLPPRSSGAVRVLLQSGPGVHRCLLWLRQLQVGTRRHRGMDQNRHQNRHPHTLPSREFHIPIWWIQNNEKKSRLITTWSDDGMNCPEEKGTDISARRTGRCGRTEKLTEMPSWIFCNIGLVNTALHPLSLPPTLQPTPPHMYIYLLCCILLLWFQTQFWVWLHFWVAPVMYFIGIYINIYKYIWI